MAKVTRFGIGGGSESDAWFSIDMQPLDDIFKPIVDNIAQVKFTPKKEVVYVSIDIDTDGDVAGANNLLSIGAAVFRYSDKQMIKTFEVNIKEQFDRFSPMKSTMEWWEKPEQQEAWKYCHQNQVEPQEAMRLFTVFAEELKKEYKVQTVCWPAAFDWPFITLYFNLFNKDAYNPFGFKSCCIGSYAWGMYGCESTSGLRPEVEKRFSEPKYKHTHKALDDALDQGAQFMNMLHLNIKITRTQSMTDRIVYKQFNSEYIIIKT